MVQLFTECVLRHYILLFSLVFVDSACKQLTMASSQATYIITDSMSVSQARNLLRPNNLSGDLTDGCVNNFTSFLQ